MTMLRASSFLKTTALLFALLVASGRSVRADDLFNMTVSPGGSVASGNNLLTLVDKIVNGKDEFAFFNGAGPAYTGTLKYGTVQNAMSFSLNGARTSALLSIPSIGFTKNFNGLNQSDLESQIKSFLKNDGSGVYARFLKSMSARSLVAVSDGNPNATTASAAALAYQSYAMPLAETREEKDAPKGSGERAAFGIIADVGAFDANGIKGTAYSLPMFARFKVSQRVGLNFDIPLNYMDIAGAKVYGIGLGMGVPVKVILKTKESPWSWQVAPFAGANISASKDMLAGGMLANGGINSMLAHDFGRFTLSMGNHFSLHEGVPITIQSYKFDPGVSQQILKNGLKLDVPLGRRWIVDVYAIHTKFLAAAALDQYFTIGGELGYRLMGKGDAAKKKGGYVKLGLYADVGDNYSSAHMQFGSGWKF